MRRDARPDFIEALARGLDVLRGFEPGRPHLSLSEVAARADLARPTARRILITLEELGYVRSDSAGFSLTPRVLELGMAYVGSQNLWELAEPHLRDLVAQTGESCSVAQLDGSDITYVARVAVPKLVTLAVTIGTRFPAVQTSLGKVLLAALDADELGRLLDTPSRSGIEPRWRPEREELDAVLRDVRAKGWAVTDQDLALGIRSVAAPIRNGQGRTVAAVNVNAHAAETPVGHLVDHHLPLLLRTAGAISADWAAWEARPITTAS
ncbi:IclR family transcriptional regulator C-terminal domain-containing protein [Amycolatopsis sp. 195334CR]|uniref:IclR family transcriptional regulator domain-containing protein n=1 Tax=Amycolatopsis sp. 195334CR TaxID=2814588 RepID=UPI001A8C19E5|nr:IclR family transcriptional regulator C-terminal domain-containing protein [Amycolatopsis sp. 195334CR]MBN6041166.1 helix-turn-helix domain-containing protein [Amycolatopsis sp. 195334CR]